MLSNANVQLLPRPNSYNPDPQDLETYPYSFALDLAADPEVAAVVALRLGALHVASFAATVFVGGDIQGTLVLLLSQQ